MKSYLLAAVAALAVAVPAQAASFNGPFVGVQLSRDGYEVKAEDTVITEEGDTISLDGLSANGFGFGIYAGYDALINPAVFLGVEANANISGASASLNVSDIARAKIEARESYGLSARVGAIVTEGTGIYARAGWQNTKFEASESFDGDSFSDSSWEDAFVYGAGLETSLGSNVAVRAEYLIEDYGSAGLNKSLGANGIRVDNYKASLGLSYRF